MVTVSDIRPPHLRFLGTGAADWPWHSPPSPLPIAPGDWRRSTMTLIDDRILVDAGPSLPDAVATFAVAAEGITDLLLTHTHIDHYDPMSVETLLAHRSTSASLRIWSPDPAPQFALNASCQVERIRAGERFPCGAYSVTALAANHHRVGGTTLHYLFEGRGTRWLYALDGGWLPCATWYALHDATVHGDGPLDALVIDATIGDIPDDYRIFQHNALPMVRMMVASLRREGMLASTAPVVVTHLARTLHGSQDEIGALVAGDDPIPGAVVAYDGLALNLSPASRSSS
ncbi:MAG: MBL fold metallo-hydrolase [Anaerolineae bacterium]